MPISAVVLPAALQHGVDQRGAGGFAVGAGDGGQGHAFVGTVVEIPGSNRQRFAAMSNLQPGTVKPPGAGPIADDSQRALLHGGIGELSAIDFGAGESEEEKARFHFAAIVSDARDIRRREDLGWRREEPECHPVRETGASARQTSRARARPAEARRSGSGVLSARQPTARHVDFQAIGRGFSHDILYRLTNEVGTFGASGSASAGAGAG